MRTLITQENQNKRIKFIELILTDNNLTRTWGLVGGKTQTTDHNYSGLNIGKSNEFPPKQVAYGDYNRIIKKKTREGYLIIESDSHQISVLPSEGIDWQSISTVFSCDKPTPKISKDKLGREANKKNLIFTKKYNGICHFILITDTGSVKIYTRRMYDHTCKYPAIVKEIKKLDFPPKTILICEFVSELGLETDHDLSFKTMSEISKVDTVKGVPKHNVERSIQRQKETPVNCVVFGMLYYEGVAIWKEWGYEPVLSQLNHYLLPHNLIKKPKYFNHEFCSNTIYTPFVYSFSFVSEAQDFLKETKTENEGIIVCLKDGMFQVNLKGKPKRNKDFYKIKVVLEDDYVAYGFVEGTGKRQGKIGGLKIGKYKDGVLVDYGRVGSGLTDENSFIEDWKFPCVIEIEYFNRFATGKLQFPVFKKVHEDKKPEEIIEE